MARRKMSRENSQLGAKKRKRSLMSRESMQTRNHLTMILNNAIFKCVLNHPNRRTDFDLDSRLKLCDTNPPGC
jgi:hypothetical protein